MVRRGGIGLLLAGVIVALVGCGAPAPSRTASCAHLDPAGDCMSRCMACGHRDYGPCLASCSTQRWGWAPAPVAPPPVAVVTTMPSEPAVGAAGAASSVLRTNPWPVRARGTLIVEVATLLSDDGSGRDADLVIETHLEQLKSRWFAGRVVERLVADGLERSLVGEDVEERLAGNVRAIRRGRSSVLEVSVSESLRAVPALEATALVDLCRVVLEQYASVALEQERAALVRRGLGHRARQTTGAVRILDGCQVTDPPELPLERY